MDTEHLKHTPPSPDRGGQPTIYLPVSGVGDVDDPYDNGGTKSVYNWDRGVDRLNAAVLNRMPEHTWSYCPDGCSLGCVEMPSAVSTLDPAEVLEAPMRRIVEALEGVGSALNSHSGEQWVDRVNQVYGPDGHFDIAAIAERTQSVYDAATAAITDTDAAAASHLEGIHNVVRQARDMLARRWDELHLKWQDLGIIPLGTGPLSLIGAPAMAAWRLWDVYQALDEHLDVDGPKHAMLESQGKADAAAKALETQLSSWTVTPNGAPLDFGSKGKDKGTGKGKPDPKPGDPQPATLTGAVTPDPTQEELRKKLNDLLGSTPGGGMPSMPGTGGGMPSMPGMGGGMPSMPGMGGGTPNPAAAGDLAPFTTDAAPDDGDDDTDGDTDGDDGDGTDGDTPPEDTPQPEDTPPPVAGDGSQPAPPDPNSPAARTVTLPDGRSVLFPTAHQADMVRHLTDADPNNPKSLYMAASEAGYTVPPMGQDIGEKVPPSLMKEGDIVSTGQTHGVYLGNGDVLMEDQSVKKLADVASFDGPSQGVFRLAEPGAGGPGLTGPSQPVGVPGDTTASASADPGVTTNVTGMDPSAASPN